MKITLIKPFDDVVLNDKLDIPYNLLVLGSILEREGHEVQILELDSNNINKIEYADVFGITCVTPTYNTCMLLAYSLFDKYCDSRIFLGGKHFGAVRPEHKLIAYSPGGMTYFVGDAETTVINALGEDRNCWIGNSASDLDSIHPLNFSLVNLFGFKRRTIAGKESVGFQTSRGCPYHCAFCYNDGYTGCISPGVFKSEIKRLEEIFGVEAINIFDDNFCDLPNVDSYLEICKESGLVFRCMVRADKLGRNDFAKELYQSGIRGVHIGIESASERMLKLMKKHEGISQMERGLKKGMDAGLKVEISMIVGFPGEDWKSIDTTVHFLRNMPYSSVSIYPFVPFPGCDVWNNPEKYDVTWISQNFDDFRPLDKHGLPAFAFETASLKMSDLRAMWDFVSSAVSQRRKFVDGFEK